MSKKVNFPVVSLTVDNIKLLKNSGWKICSFYNNNEYGLLFPGSKTVSKHLTSIDSDEVYLKHSELAGYLLINDWNTRIEYLTAIKRSKHENHIFY